MQWVNLSGFGLDWIGLFHFVFGCCQKKATGKQCVSYETEQRGCENDRYKGSAAASSNIGSSLRHGRQR